MNEKSERNLDEHDLTVIPKTFQWNQFKKITEMVRAMTKADVLIICESVLEHETEITDSKAIEVLSSIIQKIRDLI